MYQYTTTLSLHMFRSKDEALGVYILEAGHACIVDRGFVITQEKGSTAFIPFLTSSPIHYYYVPMFQTSSFLLRFYIHALVACF